MTHLTRGPLRTHIPLAELSAIDRLQLEVASKLYDGTGRTVEEMYAATDVEEEPILPSMTSHLRIDDAGTHAYDAWLYMVDAGTIFSAGTTDVVAEIIQGGLECQDPALRAALSALLTA